jgi:hypothetical protein
MDGKWAAKHEGANETHHEIESRSRKYIEAQVQSSYPGKTDMYVVSVED